MLLNVFVLIVMTGGLGAADYGVFAIVTSVVLVGNFFFEPRMQDIVAQRLWDLHDGSQHSTRHRVAVGDFLLIEAIGKLVPLAVLLALSQVLARFSNLPAEGGYFIAVAAVGTYFAKLGYGVTTGLFRVAGRSDLFAYATIGEISVRFLILSALCLSGAITVELALIVTALTGTIGMIAQWLCVGRYIIDLRSTVQGWSPAGLMARLSSIRRIALSNLGISLTDLMNKDLDITLISPLLPAAEVGVYKVAKSLVGFVWRMIDPIALALMPELNRLVGEGRYTDLGRLLKRSSLGLFAFGLVAAAAIYFGTLWFGTSVFGPAFADVSVILPFMLLGVVLSTPLVWGYPLSVALDRSDVSLVGTLIGSIFGIATLLFLVPLYGSKAAGIAWTGTMLISWLYMATIPLVLLRRRISISPRNAPHEEEFVDEIAGGGRDPTPIGGLTPPPYFFGVSDGWQDIAEDPFASQGWICHCEESAALARERRRAGSLAWIRATARRILKGSAHAQHFRLPLAFLRQRLADTGRAKVVDIGGGYGDNFEIVEHALGAQAAGLEWCVVDNARSVALGQELYGTAFPNLTLATEMGGGTFDLAVVIGTIQYIREWQEFVGSLVARGGPHIFIARSPIRLDGPSFLTVQSVSPALGASALRKAGEANIWVLGRDEMTAAMRNVGYELKGEGSPRDYSSHFARLPPAYRNVAYIDMLWGPAG